DERQPVALRVLQPVVLRLIDVHRYWRMQINGWLGRHAELDSNGVLADVVMKPVVDHRAITTFGESNRSGIEEVLPDVRRIVELSAILRAAPVQPNDREAVVRRAVVGLM